MKYLIRSVKYLFYFITVCALIIVITFQLSVKPEGLTIMDMLLAGNGLYKMLIFFVAFAAIYPALGFNKKELYIDNFKENRKEITDLFLNANYVVAHEDAHSISFRLRNPFMRLMRVFEDTVTIDFSGNPVIIEGLRKDTLRFGRGIEYICRSEEEK